MQVIAKITGSLITIIGIVSFQNKSASFTCSMEMLHGSRGSQMDRLLHFKFSKITIDYDIDFYLQNCVFSTDHSLIIDNSISS